MNPHSSSSLSFDSFPSVPGQHAAEWPSRLALITSTGQPGGLVGFILDAPTYLQDYGQPFVPFPHPGPGPAANAAGGTWKSYDLAMANWKLESQAISTLMKSIFDSLDRLASSWFFDPLRNRYNMDPTNFFVVMQREYGVADPEVVSRWINQLQEPMQPNSSVRDLVTLHRDLHSKLNMARGYVMHEDEGVRGLLQATKFSSFRPSIIQWLTEHRGAVNQTFDVLANHLCQIEIVTDSLSAPASGPMYAGLQVNQTETAGVLQANAAASSTVVTNSDLLQAIQSLVFYSAKPNAPRSSGKSKAKSNNIPAEYCWTHGYCTHSSGACRKPSEGHVITATAANPSGGRTTKWERPK